MLHTTVWTFASMGRFEAWKSLLFGTSFNITETDMTPCGCDRNWLKKHKNSLSRVGNGLFDKQGRQPPYTSSFANDIEMVWATVKKSCVWCGEMDRHPAVILLFFSLLSFHFFRKTSPPKKKEKNFSEGTSHPRHNVAQNYFNGRTMAQTLQQILEGFEKLERNHCEILQKNCQGRQ